MEAAGVEPQKTSPLNLVYHEKQVSGTMLCGQVRSSIYISVKGDSFVLACFECLAAR